VTLFSALNYDVSVFSNMWRLKQGLTLNLMSSQLTLNSTARLRRRWLMVQNPRSHSWRTCWLWESGFATHASLHLKLSPCWLVPQLTARISARSNNYSYIGMYARFRSAPFFQLESVSLSRWALFSAHLFISFLGQPSENEFRAPSNCCMCRENEKKLIISQASNGSGSADLFV